MSFVFLDAEQIRKKVISEEYPGRSAALGFLIGVFADEDDVDEFIPNFLSQVDGTIRAPLIKKYGIEDIEIHFLKGIRKRAEEKFLNKSGQFNRTGLSLMKRIIKRFLPQARIQLRGDSVDYLTKRFLLLDSSKGFFDGLQYQKTLVVDGIKDSENILLHPDNDNEVRMYFAPSFLAIPNLYHVTTPRKSKVRDTFDSIAGSIYNIKRKN